jgi:hypothetical protein
VFATFSKISNAVLLKLKAIDDNWLCRLLFVVSFLGWIVGDYSQLFAIGRPNEIRNASWKI